MTHDMQIQLTEFEMVNNAKYRIKLICLDDSNKEKSTEECSRKDVRNVTDTYSEEHSRTNL